MANKIAKLRVGSDANGRPIYKYFDLSTRNKSFIEVANALKRLGIKNWYFLLEIYDVSLVNIDPYAVDENGHSTLTQEQVSRVMTEIVRNPWYYLREIARIPDQGGTSVPYAANRGNIAQAWCIFHGIDSWLCLPRQKGKTQSALAAQGWMYSFGTTNSEFIFVNKDGDNAKTNLRRLDAQIKLLPEYLQFGEYIDEESGKREKATNNATTMRHPITKNSIIVKPKATSYDKALSLARGLTAPVIHFDEPEFTDHIKTIVSNSVSTYEQAASNAKKNGAMYGRIFTCTPGDLATRPGMEGQALLDKTAKWTERMYDMTPEQIEKYIATFGKDCNKIVYIEYQYYQIGLTNKWLEDISAKIGDPLTVRREILLQRLQGSSLSPYAQEDIEYIVGTENKPIDEIWLLDYYKFDVYRKLDPKIPYIAGVDCSTGTVNDNNAITIIHPYTLEPVAEFECSYIGETLYCKLLIELVSKYLPKLVLCIERNSVGDAIIDFLLNSKIRNNLYYDKSKDYVQENMRTHENIESMLKHQATIKSYYGVWTGSNGKGGGSRDAMFAILSRHVNEYKEKFVSHNVIRDLTRLVKTPSGAIKAGSGADENGVPFHDDSIMSYLIALYVYYHGNNLEIFGIRKGLQVNNEELNKGLKRADDIDNTLVSQHLIDSVKKQEALEDSKNQFESLMRDALSRSQRQSYQLHKSGLVNNEVFKNTPNVVMDEIEDDYSIPLDFFNGLNNY